MIMITILSLLLSNAVTLRRDMSILFNRIAIIALIYCILHDVMSLSLMSKGIGLHGGLLYVTNITQIFHIFIFFITILILQLTSFYPRKVWLPEYSTLKGLMFNSFLQYRTRIINKMGRGRILAHMNIIEYPLIILFVVSGAVFLMSTNDLVSIFLSIELQSYGLYLLSTIYRNSELSTTGGLMYFLLGGLSSCFILLGTSLLYANSGTTSLDGLYIINSISENSISSATTTSFGESLSWYKSYYINFALLIFSIGFLFKIGAAPFHFWSPDVYDAIPTIVTTFVAIVAKISILIFLLGLVYQTSNFETSANPLNSEFSWTYGLLISSLLSLIVGTVVGLTQFRIKRLLAYSTISHLGFLLLALSVSSIESTQAFIFYLMQYSITNLNAFLILITIGFSLVKGLGYITMDNGNNNGTISAVKGGQAGSSLQSAPVVLRTKIQTGNLVPSILPVQTNNVINTPMRSLCSDKINSPIQLISQLKGYFYVNPFLAISLAITIFSFVGIPPLAGFFAKQMVLSAALDNGYIFITLVAILTSVIGGVYYLNIIKEIFFANPNSPQSESNTTSSSFINNLQLDNGKSNNTGGSLLTGSAKAKDIIYISSPFSITISIITLIILLFIFINKEWLSMGKIKLKSFFISVLSHTQSNWNQNQAALNLKYNKHSLNSTFKNNYRCSRNYTTNNLNTKALDPWFISGFTDAEGSFMIHLEKIKDKIRVRPTFQIKLNIRDLSLLKDIKAYFNEIGSINISREECVYKVRSLKEVLIIISHFDKYPLLTQKYADYILFKKIIEKLVVRINKEHSNNHTLNWLEEILNIVSSMNSGLPLWAKDPTLIINKDYLKIIPVKRPIIKSSIIPHPQWMAGFISGEGSFSIIDGKYASLSFRVSQHNKDEELLKYFVNYFACGNFNYHNQDKKAVVFSVRKFNDIKSIIIPFFDKYKIEGVKHQDYLDWRKSAKIIESKGHLTPEGKQEISKYKNRMNSYRV